MSDAGGLGMLAGARITADQLRELIRAPGRLTSRPFGLNLQVPIISPEEAARPANPEPLRRLREEHGLASEPAGTPAWVGPDEAVAITLAEGIRILSVVMGPAGSWLAKARDAGAVVMATVTTVAEALEVEADGVEVVIAQGGEAGGRHSTFRPGTPDRWPLIGTMALVPQVVDAVTLPVIAAGGIMGGRGVIAALALGAEAAQLGTRPARCASGCFSGSRGGAGMSEDSLETYLNDHLAGSIGAIQMLERAVDDHAGTPLGMQLADLLVAIRAAQEELRSVMRRFGYAESPIKKAGAWLAQHAGRLKVGGSGESDLARLELFEALTLGLQGQWKLWRALRAVAAKHPPLEGIDLARLEQQSREQHDLVESWRIAAAEAAL